MKNPQTGRLARHKPLSSRKDGEEIALAALGYLAGEADRLSRFLSLSGLGPHNLRAAAADSGFLAAVLDYIMADERLLLDFAADAGLSPEAIVASRRAMDGVPPTEP